MPSWRWRASATERLATSPFPFQVKGAKIPLCAFESFRGPVLGRAFFLVLLLTLLATLWGCAPRESPPPLRLGIWESPREFFLPWEELNSAERELASFLFRGLYRREPDFRLVPELAEGYTPLPGGRSFAFRLRRLSWPDGSPITVADFAYSFLSALKYGGPYRDPLLAVEGAPEYVQGRSPGVKGIRLPDPRTVEVTFREPSPEAFSAFVLLPLVPARFQGKMTGAGPYRWERVFRDGQGRVVRVDLSPRKNRLPRVSLVLVSPPLDSRLFGAGLLDLVEVRGKAPAATAGGGPVSLVEGPGNGYYLLLLRGEARLKQALESGLDRRAFIREVLPGPARPMAWMFPPGSWAEPPNPYPFPFDPEYARSLLREAKGDRPTLELLYLQGHPVMERGARWLGESLSRLGIKAELRPARQRDLVERLRKKEFRLYLFSLPYGFGVFPEPLFRPGGFGEPANYPPKLRERAWAALSAPSSLTEAYRQMAREAAGETPYLFLASDLRTYAFGPRIKKLVVGPEGLGFYVDRWLLREGDGPSRSRGN